MANGKCPSCGLGTIPALPGGDAAACQNAECRVVIDKSGKVIGRFTEGYGVFEEEAA